MLEGDFTCFTHWKWRFICDADHWWHLFCVAGAGFGAGGMWLFVAGAGFGAGGGCLFVAGAALRDILGDSRSAKCCIFQYKTVAKFARGRSQTRRVRDDDFIVGLSSIIVGLSSIIVESSFYWRKHLRVSSLKSRASRIRGRRNIWWCWRVTLSVSRIGNDVLYVTQIIDDIYFAWQAQDLVQVECDFSWQAQHIVTFWEITGARNVVFCNTKLSPRSDREGLQSGGCEMTILSSDMFGICSNMFESSFYWRKQCRDSPLKCWHHNRVAGAVFGEVGGWLCLLRALEMTFHMWFTALMRFIHFAWQAQYLVKVMGDSCCFAHCKWRFKCDTDQAWDSFCLAGAVVGEVPGSLCLLRAL